MNAPLKHIHLYDLRCKFKVETEYLEKYLTHLNQGVLDHNNKMNSYLHEDIESNGLENEALLRDLYQDDLVKIPFYSYHSSYLLIYSLLEATMQKICKQLCSELNLPVKPEELKGTNYFEASMKYLIYFTPMNKTLIDKGNDFTPYQRIRNYIVHNGSITNSKSDNPKNRVFVKDITYEHDGSFYINNVGFLLSFLKKVEGFIESCLIMIEQLEIVPVVVNMTSVIKYYSPEEYRQYYKPVLELDPSDSPF